MGYPVNEPPRTRRVEAPIEVAFRQGQKWPHLFRLSGQGVEDKGFEDQSFEVRKLLETWVTESKWWRPGGTERRVYYQVVADPGKAPALICVLCKAENSDLPTWSLRETEY